MLFSLQIWETTYFQEMSDYQEIFDWVKGTGLRPILSEIDRSQFENEYVNAIAKEYPRQINNKILLQRLQYFQLVTNNMKNLCSV